MKQEDKNLLLQDLCARLPYNVRMHEINPINNIQLELFLASVTCESNIAVKTKNKGIMCGAIEEFKPYLFPLSSMTEEQKLYLEWFTKYRLKDGNLVVARDEDDEYLHTNIYDYLSLIEWLNRNHFDYRGLIEKGLAIDCTNLNIY